MGRPLEEELGAVAEGKWLPPASQTLPETRHRKEEGECVKS